MKTIYIDCSYLCHHPESHTGIQRVVRKVVENFSALAEGQPYQVVPVDLANGQLRPIEISSLFVQEPVAGDDAGSGSAPGRNLSLELKVYFKNLYIALRALSVALVPQRHFKNFMLAPRTEPGLSYLIDKAILNPVKAGVTFARTGSFKLPEPVSPFDQVGSDDILLLLDSTWSVDVWPSVAKIHDRGAKVVAVIYDLIPITHSQFCVDELVTLYKRWFYQSLKYVDGFVAISDTVKLDLIQFLKSYFKDDSGLGKLEDRQFDYFLLGGDHSHMDYDESKIRPDLVESLKDGSTYLMVSTVEPRKNHQYLLDAFDHLWDQGESAKLSIVGREGWKVQDTMARINNHPQKDNKLYHWGDLNDAELLYCYKKAKMLVFSSFVEGFGLPIVESLTNQLPVLASDTPIHREVGGDKIGYFDLNSPQDLANQVQKIETNGIPEEFVPSEDFSWLSWRESSQSLLNKVLKIAS